MRSCCAQTRLHYFIINNFGSYETFILKIKEPLHCLFYHKRCRLQCFLNHLPYIKTHCLFYIYFTSLGLSASDELFHEFRKIESFYGAEMRSLMDEMLFIIIQAQEEIPQCSTLCSLKVASLEPLSLQKHLPVF